MATVWMGLQQGSSANQHEGRAISRAAPCCGESRHAVCRAALSCSEERACSREAATCTEHVRCFCWTAEKGHVRQCAGRLCPVRRGASCAGQLFPTPSMPAVVHL